MVKNDGDALLYQGLVNELGPRVTAIEGDLKELVSVITDESKARLVFEEKVTTAIEHMAAVASDVKNLTESHHSLERQVLSKVATIRDRDKLHSRIDLVSRDVNDLKLSTSKNTFITAGVERVGWMLLTAAIGLASFFLRG